MKYYVGNAFACGPYTGNPAGVVVLENDLPDREMQAIAHENGHAETAFIKRDGAAWDICWFTPTQEVGLCGHATLGAAYMILNYLEAGADRVVFHTRRDGVVSCERDGEVYYLDFPTKGLAERADAPEVTAAFGCAPMKCYHNPNDPDVIYALMRDAEQVAALQPDMEILRKIPGIVGVVAMAPGTDTDYVSRFFGPAIGIPEDPVNGGTEMSMIPFWRERLGKDELTDRQLSARGGLKYLKYKGDRVSIGGRVQMYFVGEIVQ